MQQRKGNEIIKGDGEWVSEGRIWRIYRGEIRKMWEVKIREIWKKEQINEIFLKKIVSVHHVLSMILMVTYTQNGENWKRG
jgi:hypothetical protein